MKHLEIFERFMQLIAAFLRLFDCLGHVIREVNFNIVR